MEIGRDEAIDRFRLSCEEEDVDWECGVELEFEDAGFEASKLVCWVVGMNRKKVFGEVEISRIALICD